MKALDRLWAAKRPNLFRSLRAGTTSPKVPAPLRPLYAWHDGLRDQHLSVEGFFGWSSHSQMLQRKRTLDVMERDGFFDDWQPGSWWHPSWLPFMQFNLEDFVCLDAGGTLGHGRNVVFVRTNTSPTRVIIASSLARWLKAHFEITKVGPESDDDDEWVDHFGSAKAKRIRKTIDPGLPKKVKAKAVK